MESNLSAYTVLVKMAVDTSRRFPAMASKTMGRFDRGMDVACCKRKVSGRPVRREIGMNLCLSNDLAVYK